MSGLFCIRMQGGPREPCLFLSTEKRAGRSALVTDSPVDLDVYKTREGAERRAVAIGRGPEDVVSYRYAISWCNASAAVCGGETPRDKAARKRLTALDSKILARRVRK